MGRSSGKKIWGHTLVFNEENFIWFAVSSVINHLDKILIWDTGSTDKTIDVIKELIKKYPKKIAFKEIGRVDSNGVTKARQKMLEESKCDWILILDGDEIWPEKSIKNVVDEINSSGDNLDGIAEPFYNLLGDIYHYQEEKAGQYQLLGRKGHLQVRAINLNIPSLHVKNTYPLEGYYDKDDVIIQKSKRLKYVDPPYLHCTHLKRSLKRDLNKFKFELGKRFPKDFKFPEVLFKDYPKIIPSPLRKRGVLYEIIAIPRTPLVWLKRRIKIGAN